VKPHRNFSASLWFLAFSVFIMIPHHTPLTGGEVTLISEPWGTTPDGQTIDLYTLTDSAGMVVKITNYGGIIVSLTAPDRKGQFADVVLGFDSLEPYLKKHPFFGTITGRYANRIGGASFSLNGVTHQVTANIGKNHLHGGAQGFDKKVWAATSRRVTGGMALELSYTSPAGEEGYPGTLTTSVTYALVNGNTLAIDYHATTDAPTVVNLTNHSYFNLAGEGHPSILDHELTLSAEHYTPTNEQLIPTGEVASVLNTPLDFTTPKRIGKHINADFLPLKLGQGYDHNFILNGRGFKLAARVHEPKSGRVLEVRTTEPAVQLYTANHLKDIPGKNGHTYPARSAFCLETQHYPDSPNHPNFPSTVLRPKKAYHSATTFKFTAE
jgi:aldose 1-epimerase